MPLLPLCAVGGLFVSSWTCVALHTETLVDDPLEMYPQQKELREAKLVQVREHLVHAC